MQEFDFKLIEDATYCAMAYRGDEPQVTVPERFLGAPVTVLFDKLFRGHDEIRSVCIPSTVTDLGEFVFDGCAGLAHLDLPAALRHLWGHTFTRSGLEELALPDGVTSIPPFAFADCAKLRRVTCGAGMRSVSAYAFSGCAHEVELVCGPNVQVSAQAFETKVLRSGVRTA